MPSPNCGQRCPQFFFANLCSKRTILFIIGMTYLTELDFKMISASGLSQFAQDYVFVGYRLTTGVPAYIPSYKSNAGRFLGQDKAQLYLGDSPLICSGEAVGSGVVPFSSHLGTYLVSGRFLCPELFSDSTRYHSLQSNGTSRHDFSQRLTDQLFEMNMIFPKLLGWSWPTVSGVRVGLEGRCFGLWETGSPYVTFSGAYPWPF
jgi:hypothetical protein